MATNWQAMQVSGACKKQGVTQGVLPRYLSMGSWHASLSRGGQASPPLKAARRNTSIIEKKA